MNDQEIITALQGLHDLLVDSRKGYAEVAKRAHDPRVSTLLMALSNERTGMESEVDRLLVLRDAPAKHGKGTLKGNLHRMWMEVRDALSKPDSLIMLAECERGERYLLSRYEHLLPKADKQVLSVLDRHHAIVLANLARVKDARKQFELVHKDRG